MSNRVSETIVQDVLTIHVETCFELSVVMTGPSTSMMPLQLQSCCNLAANNDVVIVQKRRPEQVAKRVLRVDVGGKDDLETYVISIMPEKHHQSDYKV